MVAAGKDELLALAAVLVLEDGVGTMATDVVEGVDLAFLVFNQEEVEAGHLEAKEATGLGETRTMGGHEPVLGEDGTLLQVEEGRLMVPGGGHVALGDLERHRHCEE